MKLKIEVTVETKNGDETYTAKVDGRDIRQWETAHSQSFFDAGLSYTTLTELAYSAMVRAKDYRGTREEFLDQCVSVAQVEMEEAAANPTRKAATGKQRQR